MRALLAFVFRQACPVQRQSQRCVAPAVVFSQECRVQKVELEMCCTGRCLQSRMQSAEGRERDVLHRPLSLVENVEFRRQSQRCVAPAAVFSQECRVQKVGKRCVTPAVVISRECRVQKVELVMCCTGRCLQSRMQSAEGRARDVLHRPLSLVKNVECRIQSQRCVATAVVFRQECRVQNIELEMCCHGRCLQTRMQSAEGRARDVLYRPLSSGKPQ